MMVLKHFIFPCSPPKVVKKKGYRGSGLVQKLYLEQLLSVLSGNQQFSSQVSSSSLIHSQTLHGYTSSQVQQIWVSNSSDATQQTQPDLSRSLSVGGTSRNSRESSVSYLSQGNGDRLRLETHSIAQLTVPASQALSLSFCVLPVPAIISPLCALPQHESCFSMCIQSA